MKKEYKHLIYTNPVLQAQDKAIREAIKTKYEDQIYQLDDKTFFTEGKVCLLSWNTFTKEIVRMRLVKIPVQKLEEAKVLGTEFMLYLQEMWEKKITDLDKINYLSEQLKLMFLKFIQWMIDNKWEIRAVEKYVTNGTWHGYIDMICRDEKHHLAPVEIKTRGNNQLKESDKVQLAIYTYLLGEKVRYGYVIIVNRKTMEITKYKVNCWNMVKEIAAINELLKILDLCNYCFKKKKKVKEIINKK